MSIGIGAHANLVLWDEQTIIYEYGGYNLNEEQYRNETGIYDGIITIQRCCFLEPKIHEKYKRMPSGKKKLITKKIPVEVDYPRYIDEGLIVVENCSNCWETTNDEKRIDVMALWVLFYLFLDYQKQGRLPEYISLYK